MTKPYGSVPDDFPAYRPDWYGAPHDAPISEQLLADGAALEAWRLTMFALRERLSE